MNRTEPNASSQKLDYHLELPSQFTSWIQFYDELTRLGLVQPTTTIIRIKVFRAADTIREGDSLSSYLTYERQHIERMCLDEFRRERSSQSSYWLTVAELEQLIQIVSNQASRLTDWDLLLKLKALLQHKQQEIKLSDSHLESGH